MSKKLQKRMPKDLREVVEAYLSLSSKSRDAFLDMCANAGPDSPWLLDQWGYAVPRSITAIGKPIEESERDRTAAQREWEERKKQERRDWLRAKRQRREQRFLAFAAPQGSA
jgi:hypothetical protein